MKALASCLICSSFLASTLFAASPLYHAAKEIHLGSEGGWDYLTVDSEARRLYVSHATRVMVVDLDSGKLSGEIPDTPGVHGIAIAPDLGKGFTSNGRANTVSVFDLKTLQVTAHVSTGQNPDAIQYEPLSHRVFTFNGKSHDTTAFDARTGKVEATIPLGGKPEFSVTDGKGTIFVNIEDTSEIAVIDAASLKVTKRFPLKPCESPSGLSIDLKSSTLFSVCDSKVMAISSAAQAKLLTTVPIGEGPDGAAFDPKSGHAFSSNGEGTLTIVGQQSGTWKALATIPTAKGARTMTIDPKTQNLYLPTADPDPASPPTSGERPKWKADSFKLLVLSR